MTDDEINSRITSILADLIAHYEVEEAEMQPESRSLSALGTLAIRAGSVTASRLTDDLGLSAVGNVTANVANVLASSAGKLISALPANKRASGVMFAMASMTEASGLVESDG